MKNIAILLTLIFMSQLAYAQEERTEVIEEEIIIEDDRDMSSNDNTVIEIDEIIKINSERFSEMIDLMKDIALRGTKAFKESDLEEQFLSLGEEIEKMMEDVFDEDTMERIEELGQEMEEDMQNPKKVKIKVRYQ